MELSFFYFGHLIIQLTILILSKELSHKTPFGLSGRKDFLQIFFGIFLFSLSTLLIIISQKRRKYKVFTVLRFLIFMCYPTFPRTRFRVY